MVKVTIESDLDGNGFPQNWIDEIEQGRSKCAVLYQQKRWIHPLNMRWDPSRTLHQGSQQRLLPWHIHYSIQSEPIIPFRETILNKKLTNRILVNKKENYEEIDSDSDSVEEKKNKDRQEMTVAELISFEEKMDKINE